jgi:GT2 family glycosyltransferase
LSGDPVISSQVANARPYTPSFSIIVPTWNRPNQLRACLEALAGLEYPATRFEIIVVDDGSEPRVDPADFDRLNGRVTWLRQANAGPAAARNAGAGRAQGEYLAFTDDDCTPAPGWLKGLARAFEQTPRALVGGRTANALSDNIYAIASQAIVEAARAYYSTTRSELEFFASNNLALPVDLFRTMGGFDPSFRTSEDRDLCDRLMRGGHRLVYAPDAVIHHRHELILTRFWRQHFGYGRGAYRFHRARARRGAGPFRPELSFYRSVLRYPFTRVRDGRTASLAALFFLWQVANAAGFLWQACRHLLGRDLAEHQAQLDRIWNQAVGTGTHRRPKRNQ